MDLLQLLYYVFFIENLKSFLKVFIFHHHLVPNCLPKLFLKLDPKELFLYVHHLNNPHQQYFFILEWMILVLNIRIIPLLFFNLFNHECVSFYVHVYHYVHDRGCDHVCVHVHHHVYDHVCVHVHHRVYDHVCDDGVLFQNNHF